MAPSSLITLIGVSPLITSTLPVESTKSSPVFPPSGISVSPGANVTVSRPQQSSGMFSLRGAWHFRRADARMRVPATADTRIRQPENFLR